MHRGLTTLFAFIAVVATVLAEEQPRRALKQMNIKTSSNLETSTKVSMDGRPVLGERRSNSKSGGAGPASFTSNDELESVVSFDKNGKGTSTTKESSTQTYSSGSGTKTVKSAKESNDYIQDVDYADYSGSAYAAESVSAGPGMAPASAPAMDDYSDYQVTKDVDAELDSAAFPVETHCGKINSVPFSANILEFFPFFDSC